MGKGDEFQPDHGPDGCHGGNDCQGRHEAGRDMSGSNERGEDRGGSRLVCEDGAGAGDDQKGCCVHGEFIHVMCC